MGTAEGAQPPPGRAPDRDAEDDALDLRRHLAQEDVDLPPRPRDRGSGRAALPSERAGALQRGGGGGLGSGRRELSRKSSNSSGFFSLQERRSWRIRVHHGAARPRARARATGGFR